MLGLGFSSGFKCHCSAKADVTSRKGQRKAPLESEREPFVVQTSKRYCCVEGAMEEAYTFLGKAPPLVLPQAAAKFPRHTALALGVRLASVGRRKGKSKTEQNPNTTEPQTPEECKRDHLKLEHPRARREGSWVLNTGSSFQVIPPSTLSCNSDPSEEASQGALFPPSLPARTHTRRHPRSPGLEISFNKDLQYQTWKKKNKTFFRLFFFTKNLYDKMYIIIYLYIYFSLFKYFHVVLFDIQYGLPTMAMVSTALITPRPLVLNRVTRDYVPAAARN